MTDQAHVTVQDCACRPGGRDQAMQIEVMTGDIVLAQVEVLVTAANAALVGGGGVDGAIHRAAGPELLSALRSLAPCRVGGAVITPSFRIPAPVRFIVHAVGPRYGVDEPAAELLSRAYAQSLARCDEVRATSVAFPALSTGAYGYPLPESCRISVAALKATITQVERCVLVAYDAKTQRLWQRELT
jgi:O-acetyl-ADP-ribose deacetylase (regulator of RNase III)